MCLYMQSDVGNERSSEIGVKLIKCELKRRIIQGTEYNKVERGMLRSMYEGRGLRTQGNTVCVK